MPKSTTGSSTKMACNVTRRRRPGLEQPETTKCPSTMVITNQEEEDHHRRTELGTEERTSDYYSKQLLRKVKPQIRY
mgnify:CR=1